MGWLERKLQKMTKAEQLQMLEELEHQAIIAGMDWDIQKLEGINEDIKKIEENLGM